MPSGVAIAAFAGPVMASSRHRATSGGMVSSMARSMQPSVDRGRYKADELANGWRHGRTEMMRWRWGSCSLSLACYPVSRGCPGPTPDILCLSASPRSTWECLFLFFQVDCGSMYSKLVPVLCYATRVAHVHVSMADAAASSDDFIGHTIQPTSPTPLFLRALAPGCC